jgi:SAM-dependent methyltransferase
MQHSQAWDSAYRRQIAQADSSKPDVLWQETPIPFLQDLELNRQLQAAGVLRILDAGCGDGRNARWLERQGFFVIGVDFSRAAVEMAATKAVTDGQTRLVFLEDDITNMRLTGPIDCVVCSDALGQLEQPELALIQFSRVLRPGGLVIFNLYTPEDGTFGAGRKIADLAFEYKGTLFRYHTLEMAKALVVGWDDVAVAAATWPDPPHGEFRPVAHIHHSWVVTARKAT